MPLDTVDTLEQKRQDDGPVELVNLRVNRVDLVDLAANRHKFLVLKRAEGGDDVINADEEIVLEPVSKADLSKGEEDEKAEKAQHEHLAAMRDILNKLNDRMGSLPEDVRQALEELARHLTLALGQYGYGYPEPQTASKGEEGSGAGDVANTGVGQVQAQLAKSQAAADPLAEVAKGLRELRSVVDAVQKSIEGIDEIRKAVQGLDAIRKAQDSLKAEVDKIAKQLSSLEERVDQLERARGVRKSAIGQSFSVTPKSQSVWAGILG